MERLKCAVCGKPLEFLEYRCSDADPKNNELYIEELWECSECENLEVVEFHGKLEKIVKWKR